MNQKQRDYFVNRVTALTSDKIKSLKAMHAGNIQKISDDKYNDFVEALGLSDQLNHIKTAQDVLEETSRKVLSILKGVSELLPEYDNSYDKPSLYMGARTDVYAIFENYLRACCKEQATKEFYKTQEGAEIDNLERSQREAIDTIMMDGCKVDDLTLKLNSILENTGVQLLKEGGI